MRAETRKLLCVGRKEETYCVWGSVRAERRKLLCAEEREGGKKKIIVSGSLRAERRKLIV